MVRGIQVPLLCVPYVTDLLQLFLLYHIYQFPFLVMKMLLLLRDLGSGTLK